jgi:hypothetical protein
MTRFMGFPVTFPLIAGLMRTRDSLRLVSFVDSTESGLVVSETVCFDSFIQTFLLSSNALMSQMYQGTKKVLDHKAERFVSDEKLHYECAGR